MVSIGFIYFFLPVFMAVYALLKPEHRWFPAVCAGALFVAWVDIRGLIPMAISVFSGYFGGLLIDKFRKSKRKKRLILIFSVLLNIAAFLMFAYSNYDLADFVSGYALTASKLRLFTAFGVSVYPLHSISYCADIYMEKYSCQRSLPLVAQYITFFPCLTAGPLVRYSDIEETLKNPMISSEKISGGIELFLMGLAKKLILGNVAYGIWCSVRELNVSGISAVTAWVGIICFSFSFYYEFSGFSSMARGVSLMMGFELPENMKKPFASASFYDFINNFNCSVYSWFYTYVKLPLSKETDSKSRNFIAMLVMTVLMSMWYGFGLRTLTFGLFILLMVCLEKLLKKPLSALPLSLRCVLLNFTYLIGIPLLAMKNPAEGISYILAMFGFNKISGDMQAIYLLKTSFITILLCTLFSSNAAKFFSKKIKNVNQSVLSIASPVYTILLLLLSTAFISAGKAELLGFLF